MNPEQMLTTRRVYDGKILSLRVDTVRLPNGATATREVIEHHGAAGVVAFDADGRLLLVRQHRYPIEQSMLELPAGKLDPGETPEQCARRELEEETGYACGSLTPLGTVVPAAAYLTEVVHLFLARELIPSRQRLDADEFLSVEPIDFDEAVRLVMAGRLTDGKTQVGVLKAALLRRDGLL
ncbi:MAG: NUDIX hydrolase [Oscillospiraceae bacterium]